VALKGESRHKRKWERMENGLQKVVARPKMLGYLKEIGKHTT